jgi:hypothetical protein
MPVAHWDERDPTGESVHALVPLRYHVTELGDQTRRQAVG